MQWASFLPFQKASYLHYTYSEYFPHRVGACITEKEIRDLRLEIFALLEIVLRLRYLSEYINIHA